MRKVASKVCIAQSDVNYLLMRSLRRSGFLFPLVNAAADRAAGLYNNVTVRISPRHIAMITLVSCVKKHGLNK